MPPETTTLSRVVPPAATDEGVAAPEPDGLVVAAQPDAFCGVLGVMTAKSAALSSVSCPFPSAPPGLRSYERLAFVEPRLASVVPSLKAEPALRPTASTIVLSGRDNATPPSSVIPVA